MELTFSVVVADASHSKWAQIICDSIESAAKLRGTGIAKRKPEYIQTKIDEGKAVIALGVDAHGQEYFAGFCYIETWGHGRYVANSGLIVVPEYRNAGLAIKIKETAFLLSRKKYPEAKMFGITTSHAVMKINTKLGYVPVPFSELTDDDDFWKGCSSCPNYDILQRTGRKMCLCTGMLFDPVRHSVEQSAPVQIEIPELPEKAQQHKRSQQPALRFVPLHGMLAEA